MLTAHRCPDGGTSSPFSCLTERPSTKGYTTKWCRRLAACPSGKLGSTSSPAAPILPPGFTPKYSLLSTIDIFVASEATKTNAASSEGGRGWSVARATTIITSKTLARFRALAQNQARRGGWKLKVFTDQELHPPLARQQASPAFSSDPTNAQSWERSQAASAPPCNASKWVLWRCNPPCVVAFWMHNVPWHANQPSQARPQGRDRSSHRLGLCRPSHLPFFQLSGNGSPSKQSTQHQSQSKIHSQTATQSAPHCTLVKHAKDPGISTFSLKKMGKLVSFCGGPS